MDMRIGYSVVFSVIVAALILCAILAARSPKSIGKAVCTLCLALIPLVMGNLIVIASSDRTLSRIGYYIYFIGYDIFMFALVKFTDEYCQGLGTGQQKPTIVYSALAADTLQLLISIFTGHTFDIELTVVQGKPYYKIIPYLGQTVHRIIIYMVFFAVLLIFILASAKTARIYREKYTVILISMISVAAWETFYIFSGKPIDRSMIGMGCFGPLVFYFSIYYRPLRLLDRMLSDLASGMPEAMFVFDPMKKCIWANEQGMKLTGISEKELDTVPEILEGLLGKLDFRGNDWSDKLTIGSGDSAIYYAIEMHSVKDNDKNDFAGSFLTIQDITEEQRRVAKELYNSTHDSLTGLYTKQHLFSMIRRELGRHKNTEYLAIFVDVKNFKIVNDIFSYAFGDMAIWQIANRIRTNVSDRSVYGRLAGDTFGIFMPKADFNAEATEEQLSNFTVTDGSFEHHLLIHLGIYEVAEHDTDVSVMFDRAHLSLSSIADDYKTHIAYYDNELRDKMLWDQQISASLDEAIRQKQIRPYLQPITDNDGQVVGAEALARWIHPEHGFLSPAAFIPVLEKNGMIIEVDRHMWRCTCEILSDWKGVHDDCFISVNISPNDFYFIDVVAEIKALVKEYDIDPIKLRIEITETVMMNESEERMKILADLRAAGFIVEMDDFGSGYSSLNLLKEMPVDVLKIDMKFLSQSGDKKRARTIVKNIIRLSDELDIASLTEGVETEPQFSSLSDMGCRMFQGYYFSKPLPVDQFEEYAFGAKKEKE